MGKITDKIKSKFNSKRGTAALMIEVATNEIGYIEGPKDNETKYGKFVGVNFLPWCGSFIMWCADQSGVKVPNTVSTIVGANAFKKNNQWFPVSKAKPEPGDIVYFDFPHDGVDKISHVGLVVKDNGDGTITTIEGNTAGPKKNSTDQRNGGEVAQKIRAYKKSAKIGLPMAVVGFGRPEYKK